MRSSHEHLRLDRLAVGLLLCPESSIDARGAIHAIDLPGHHVSQMVAVAETLKAHLQQVKDVARGTRTRGVVSQAHGIALVEIACVIDLHGRMTEAHVLHRYSNHGVTGMGDVKDSLVANLASERLHPVTIADTGAAEHTRAEYLVPIEAQIEHRELRRSSPQRVACHFQWNALGVAPDGCEVALHVCTQREVLRQEAGTDQARAIRCRARYASRIEVGLVAGAQ